MLIALARRPTPPSDRKCRPHPCLLYVGERPVHHSRNTVATTSMPAPRNTPGLCGPRRVACRQACARTLPYQSGACEPGEAGDREPLEPVPPVPPCPGPVPCGVLYSRSTQIGIQLSTAFLESQSGRPGPAGVRSNRGCRHAPPAPGLRTYIILHLPRSIQKRDGNRGGPGGVPVGRGPNDPNRL